MVPEAQNIVLVGFIKLRSGVYRGGLACKVLAVQFIECWNTFKAKTFHEVVDLPSWSMLPVQGLRAMIVAVVAIAVGYFSIGDQPPSAPDIVEPSGDLEHCR